ncbi:MAG: hypothetical protein RJA23_546 [Bacteroidota bacterium]|jgi:hypothetical protein
MWQTFTRSFPIQLFLLHLQKNLSLLLVWVLLLGIVLQQFGVVLGIPYLFLDPEYLNKVSWLSFFWMGLGLAVFTMAFHMTTYIMDGWRFSFLAVVHRPFIHFCFNNSIVPLLFYLIYTIQFVSLQLDNEQSNWEVLRLYLGFSLGSILAYALLFGYLSLTNKGFFMLFSETIDKRLRRVSRSHRLKKGEADPFNLQGPSVWVYLNLKLKWEAVRPDISRFETAKLLRVFHQNHWNLFLIQVFLVSVILLLGLFNEEELLQFPAAMSALLLLAILLMAIGALTFWLRTWAAVAVLVLVLGANYFSTFSWLNKPHQAYGMDYSPTPAPYNLERLNVLTHPDTLRKDKEKVLQILDRWRGKFPEATKPKLVLVAASGGGQRSALWTLKVLQELHTQTAGALTQHTFLYTGASGGVIGEAFFRELYLRSQTDPNLDLGDPDYLQQLAADNLNPILFSLLVNDLLFPTQKLEYKGRVYSKDRGFAFEEQLNKNTKEILNKSLADYKEPEALAQIPLLPLTTLITNDGRKLVISPHSFSFFGSAGLPGSQQKELKQSIDFMRFFAAHDPGNLRFLTALRMSATFPFITPNVELPSNPVMKTMDTGLSDNFGIQDALRFLYVFQEWIGANTSGVVLVTIRDSEKSPEISSSASTQILEKIGSPLKNIYVNWDKMQTIHNEVLFNYMATSMPFGVEKIEFEYAHGQLPPQGLETMGNMQRASLNWRLTAKEKRSIIANIQTQSNQAALARAKKVFH